MRVGRIGVAATILCLALAGWAAPAALAASPEPTPAGTAGTVASTPDEEPTEPSSPEQTEENEPTVPPDPGSPSPSPTMTVTATPSAMPTPTATASPVPPTTPQRTADAIPAAWREAAAVDPASWITAVIVLLAALVLVGVLGRHRDVPVQPLPEPPPGPAASTATGAVEAGLGVLEAVGEAMIDAGYSVTGVRSALVDIATVNGYPATEIVVLPTALFVSTRGHGEVHTGAVSSGHFPLRLNQIDALDDVVRAARSAPSAPGSVRAGIAAVRSLTPPYSAVQRVAAYTLLSASLAVLLGGSWAGVGAAAVLGLAVGVLLLLTETVARQYQALVTVGTAFVVSAAVFSLTQYGVDPGVLAALIAPLVTFLPGALLTTGVIELATGQMMAGAGRLAAGTMQLILLAVGIVAGATLVGVPQLDLSQAQDPLGPLAPWLAVALFGIGVVVHQCGRPSSIGWILVVLYVAYGAQVIGDLFLGGVLSAAVGALAMTPVAYLVSRQRSGPAAFACFLPAFWLLVPGALGLVGVASILDGDSAGLTTLVTTASTMVAIMLGILAGTALGARLAGGRTVVAV
jgi:uncharacterized membrane protein YjjP (DUF1212 family)/uncharacterized membrane protein YjjB (DUF3815 family)